MVHCTYQPIFTWSIVFISPILNGTSNLPALFQMGYPTYQPCFKWGIPTTSPLSIGRFTYQPCFRWDVLCLFGIELLLYWRECVLQNACPFFGCAVEPAIGGWKGPPVSTIPTIGEQHVLRVADTQSVGLGRMGCAILKLTNNYFEMKVS